MDKFIESRPQRLCLMCGKCCRVATTPITYDELVELVNQGDEGAIDFLSIFEPYREIEDARKVLPEVVDNILKALEKDPEAIKKTTFYKCKYILGNNLCGRYKDRPELCERFPTSAWSVIPPGCGYEGWLFKYREELKQRIRKQKESLIEFEAMLKVTNDPQIIEKLKNAIDKINKTVESFAKYGSSDW